MGNNFLVKQNSKLSCLFCIKLRTVAKIMTKQKIINLSQIQSSKEG